MKQSNPDHPIIGIVGGMGPYAGLDLLQKIFDETEAANDQGHLPVAMLSYSHRINDRTEYLLYDDGPNPAYEIADIALQLGEIGAVVAGMPCNSAHAPPIFGLVEAELKNAGNPLRLLNMISETTTYIKATYTSIHHIGVLSTDSVFHLGIYRDSLAAAGFTPILPSREVQENIVHRAIYAPDYGIKAQSRPVTTKARGDILHVINRLHERGAEAIILGCTELPLAVPESSLENVPMIDPTRILARALIANTYPQKLRPPP